MKRTPQRKPKRTSATGALPGDRDPWVPFLVLGAVAAITLLVTGSASDVPIVLAPLLLALGIRAA